MSRRALIDVALGRDFAELVVLNGRLVNVSTQEIYGAGVAIALVRAALACHNGMATFAQAGVSDKDK